METYISLFKKYPNVFPRGYFRFLKSTLQKHINNDTIQYKNGVLLTWKIYKKNCGLFKKDDVKICQLINNTPGNGESSYAIIEFLTKHKRVWLQVKTDNKRAVKFYKKMGFKIVQEVKINKDNKNFNKFGKPIQGLLMNNSNLLIKMENRFSR